LVSRAVFLDFQVDFSVTIIYWPINLSKSICTAHYDIADILSAMSDGKLKFGEKKGRWLMKLVVISSLFPH
jgi:hypothetical protein